MFSKFRADVEKLAGEHAKYLEIPKDPIADMALPCFFLAKQMQKPPNEMAAMLAAEIKKKIKKSSLVGDVRAAGPYVNFYINYGKFAALVLKNAQKPSYGAGKKKKELVLVEYPGVNIAKPMSVGHLRSAIIGQSLYNIYKRLGYRVVSDEHAGDWGTQFGNLIYAYKAWGDPKKVAENPIKELLGLYVRFHKEAEADPSIEQRGRDEFAKLEKGDKSALRLWRQFKEWSAKEFEKLYKRIGLKVDYHLGESFYLEMAKQVISEALEKGIALKEQGAVIIPMNGTPLLIQKSDESTLYATRDLATIKYRMEKFHPYRMLYNVGSEQVLYFKQVFHAAKQLGYIKGDEPVHVSFGLVSLPEGKMSTRAGRVIFLEDFMNEAARRALEVIEEKNPVLKNKEKTAEKIAMAAIKYNDLSKDRVHNIVFNWSALSFEGDTGPYLQYTAVRAKSILKTSKKKPKFLHVLKEKEETEIIKQLSFFSGVIENSARDLKPHYIANYLFALASKFNEYYHKTKIIGSSEEESRLALVFAVVNVMTRGLALLGIEVPDEM